MAILCSHLSGDFVYISLFNIFDSIENVNLSSVFGSLPAKFQYALVTEKSIKKVGDQVSAGSVTSCPTSPLCCVPQQQLSLFPS